MAATARERKQQRSILSEDGSEVRCPRCTELRPVGELVGKFEQIEWAVRWTRPVCCCPGCNWKFAVDPSVLERAA